MGVWIQRFIHESLQQINRKSKVLLVGGLIIAAIVVVMVLSGPYLDGQPLSYLTRDPAGILEAPFYIGALSFLGIMFWSGAVAVCMLAYALLRGDSQWREWTGFFLGWAGLSALLLLDDAYMIHDYIIPDILGLPEKSMYLVYLAWMGFMIYRFHHLILRTDFILLGLALFFFALSAGSDTLLPFTNLESFIEDSFKFAGILWWSVYFFTTAWQTLRRPAAEQTAYAAMQSELSARQR